MTNQDTVSSSASAVPVALATVDVCICTYRRPALLDKLLGALTKQCGVGREFNLRCVVVDNDQDRSAQPVVARYPQLVRRYAVESERNFARVRNRAVALAEADFICFIDDDEYPVTEWLAELLGTLNRFGGDGVLGPVRPYFDAEPPAWIVRGRMCDRSAHPTGTVLNFNQCRTGNVLLRRGLFEQLAFDPAFGTGGEDVDFFKRAIGAGRRFVWCEEAPAYEIVPAERCRKSYFLKRALLLGRVSLRRQVGDRLSVATRLRVIVHSGLALLLYSLALPFLFLVGFHHGMKFLIKWCHHFSRACAAVGVHLVPERTF